MSDPTESFATPRAATDAGRVLLVHPNYKDTWDVPGGYIEHGESPAAACRRDITEELDLDRKSLPPPVSIDRGLAKGRR